MDNRHGRRHRQDHLAALPAAQHRVTDALLPIIEQARSGAGAVWHGHPVWSLGPAPGRSPTCYVKAYSGHVTFGFWRGRRLSDPAGRLQGAAREMAAGNLRHLERRGAMSSPRRGGLS